MVEIGNKIRVIDANGEWYKNHIGEVMTVSGHYCDYWYIVDEHGGGVIPCWDVESVKSYKIHYRLDQMIFTAFFLSVSNPYFSRPSSYYENKITETLKGFRPGVKKISELGYCVNFSKETSSNEVFVDIYVDAAVMNTNFDYSELNVDV